MTNSIKLDETIQAMFPVSMFPTVDEPTMVLLYRAYSVGFKDGYAKKNPNVIIESDRKPTIGEYLYAAQQKGS